MRLKTEETSLETGLQPREWGGTQIVSTHEVGYTFGGVMTEYEDSGGDREVKKYSPFSFLETLCFAMDTPVPNTHKCKTDSEEISSQHKG